MSTCDGSALQLFTDAVGTPAVPDVRDLGSYTAELDLGALSLRVRSTAISA